MAVRQFLSVAGGGKRRGSTLFQVVLLRVVAERPEAHAEEFGGSHLHSTGALQRQRQVVPVKRLASRLQIETLAQCRQFGRRRRNRGSPEAYGIREAFRKNSLRPLVRDRALNGVLQFPDIAAPLMVLQQPQRRA